MKNEWEQTNHKVEETNGSALNLTLEVCSTAVINIYLFICFLKENFID
jgi:hypothetical protein